jgi:hypothetical protein
VPVSSFPFLNYYPDTGTGSDYLNRTFVEPLAQPLFKQASRRLTPLYTATSPDMGAGLLLRHHAMNALLAHTTSRLYSP